jgi:hypothetical protein
MKHLELICLVLVLMFVVAGCKKKEPEPPEQAGTEAQKEPTKPPAPTEQTKPTTSARRPPAEKRAAKTTAPVKSVEPKRVTETTELTDADESLRKAVGKGDIGLVESFLAKGADVNAKARGDVTPLHIALITGHEEVAAVLIAKGADAHAKMTNGTTPLHFAAMRCFRPQGHCRAAYRQRRRSYNRKPARADPAGSG